MAKLDLSQAEFLFHSDALSGASLLVHQFSGRESLSRPFEFLIDLVCEDPDLDLEAPIGQPACLTLRGRHFDGSRYSRYVHGVIERFIQIGAGVRQSRYQASLVPTIKPLAFTRNSRIFQKQSGPDVTQKVLKDDKVPSDWVSTMLHGSYGARDYCVQYQESDLDFIQRLWEEEGIFYFFEHENDKDKLMLGDGGHAFSDLPAYSEVQLRDRPHLHEECLFEFRAESVLRPGATVLRDFKFKQPTLDMEATAQADKFADYKMYFFPGEYVDPALGKQYAKLRLEELQCRKSRFVGTGSVRAMLPGHKFSLAGHRRDDCNQEYLIVAVEHRGTQPQALAEEGEAKHEASYQNRIECIPAKVPFRPSRETPRPSIPGVQTAVVVGPPGEEIHCDEHGRVKVKFHWDRDPGRDDNSSCWIRVSQPWGGAGQGGMFIPRISQEVVIQFLEGDPDRPLIVGRVYNGENSVPHGLPAAKNISTIRSASTPGGGGYNEIKFDDSKGKEEVFVHAQFDMNEVVEHNHNTTVHADQSNTVDGSQTETIKVDQTLAVDGNQTETVKKNQTSTVTEGDQSITVKTGTRTLTVKGDVTETVQTGNHSTTIQTGASSLTVKQDRNVTVQSGSHNVTVQTGDSNHTVDTGHHNILVLTGNSTLTVNTGSHASSILTGDHTVTVDTGNSTVNVLTGKHTTSAQNSVSISSEAADLQLTAATAWSGHGGVSATLTSPEIQILGLKKIVLGVGPSSITIEPSGISITGPQITSSAIGVHTISGALIKIN
jgi:type VI secretion system secreted protein VgrG